MSDPKLSISNLAWTQEEDEEVVVILEKHDVQHIDLAMGRYFEKPHEVAIDDWRGVKKFWASKGIAIAGMQSLLFGVPPVSLFDSEENRKLIRRALEAVFARAQAIGVTRLVFGSPVHRLLPSSPANSAEMAKNFFGEVAQSAKKHEVVLLIEPNSKRFNCNFLNNAREAAEFVLNISNSSLGVNLDLGAEFDADGDLSFSPQEVGTFGHVHLSEPDLSPLSNNPLFSRMASDPQLLNNFEYLTIEQLGRKGSSNLTDVRGSLAYARGILTK
jgi:D-psicose/D-tagatose/L-ribulose 3-epimerase